ncbi:DUF2631 domain-containing protein [Corynebacterium sp. YIM 101645]|uniref:DUF2631 domain-containing protein n=1 Tax=Corynebacterium lemuris TaxID=1859292 RepID=A0ABT2FVI2_9CORY|nr:DUF2631 domain-containing protein [Corynebacterium lemuris]MCS5479241.1 DUF2631 domain-containing protein [Corynebacterium lemuris]
MGAAHVHEKEKNVAASHEIVPEVHNGTSTLDVPSAAVGWSELSRTTVQVSGWVSVLILLGYNFGNHEGHVETIWLLVLASLVAIGLLIHLFEPKLNQVRTLSSRNQPVGHKEPEWAYDQKTLSGAYSSLTDSQLIALNIDPARVRHLRELDVERS